MYTFMCNISSQNIRLCQENNEKASPSSSAGQAVGTPFLSFYGKTALDLQLGMLYGRTEVQLTKFAGTDGARGRQFPDLDTDQFTEVGLLFSMTTVGLFQL